MTDRAAARRDRAAAPTRKKKTAASPADDDAPRSIDPLDREIGRRVRTRRVAAGLSQKRLAALLGVRFQQIQKYENGANRIAASRLLDIANALETPIEHFYVDLQPTLGPGSDLIDRIQSIPEAGPALATFGAIPDAVVRRKLLSLARSIAGQVDAALKADDDAASTVGNDSGAP